jgi:hypothetical protein
MKYVLLIHSNPQPWGHPTSDYVPEFQALAQEQRQVLNDDFESIMADLHAKGELVVAEALGEPSMARLFQWADGHAFDTDGPYSETHEHLAGFFLIDVVDQARAEQVAAKFAGPGETVELRPVMWPGGDDQ